MRAPPWPLFLLTQPSSIIAARGAAALPRRATLASRRHQMRPYSRVPLATGSLFDDECIDRRPSSSLKWCRYAENVLPLWVADMDFKSPQCVIDALQARAAHGIFGYTSPPPELKDTVVDYLSRVHKWKVDPSWIVWLHGLVPGLAVVSRMAVVDEGDETMINTPIYPPFLYTPKTAGMRVTSVPLVFDEEAQDWAMDYDAMESLVSNRARLFMLCNPHNPVGKVFSGDELRRLGDFCERHDLVLCSDEIHCDLVLSPSKQHVPLAAALGEDVMARTVTLHAPSKTYNIPGLCCSYAIIPDDDLRQRFKKAARGFVTEINCMGYEACIAAYKDGEPWRLELIKYLRDNRDYAIDFIKTRIPGLRVYPSMDATYLMWLDARPLLQRLPRGSDPATFFLIEAKVGLSDGRDFAGPGHVRLNLGCRREVLQEALERMERAVLPYILPG